jgi:hypothetical protein
VNVALHGADHHLALARRAGGGQQRTQDGHSRLHRVGRQQHFRNEQYAIAEIDTDDAHAFNQRFRQHPVGHPAPAQQNVDRRLDLFLEAVIQVVVDLLDKLFVVQGVEVQFAFVAHREISGSNISGQVSV